MHRDPLPDPGLGRTQAINTLLNGSRGWFHQLRKDYDLPPIHFDADCIHVVRGAQERVLDDICEHSVAVWAARCPARAPR